MLQIIEFPPSTFKALYFWIGESVPESPPRKILHSQSSYSTDWAEQEATRDKCYKFKPSLVQSVWGKGIIHDVQFLFTFHTLLPEVSSLKEYKSLPFLTINLFPVPGWRFVAFHYQLWQKITLSVGGTPPLLFHWFFFFPMLFPPERLIGKISVYLFKPGQETKSFKAKKTVLFMPKKC